ncbi:MAG: hypothetical protein EOO65_06250 [Methanosarcinales archaeon]|nr:MAG: hypothetical protein EOO65_06250 [Methanosarcinales archaeon]
MSELIAGASGTRTRRAVRSRCRDVHTAHCHGECPSHRHTEVLRCDGVAGGAVPSAPPRLQPKVACTKTPVREAADDEHVRRSVAGAERVVHRHMAAAATTDELHGLVAQLVERGTLPSYMADIVPHLPVPARRCALRNVKLLLSPGTEGAGDALDDLLVCLTMAQSMRAETARAAAARARAAANAARAAAEAASAR